MSDNGIVVPEEETKPTEKAFKEATRIARGNLKRDEAVRTNIHYAGLAIFWFIVTIAILLGLVWAWHLGTPERLHFLTTEQRSDIETVLLAAIGSSFATQIARRWADPKKSSDIELSN